MKKLVSIILAVAIFSSMSAFAMSTSEFDNGMRKGIDYFNRGMYYEARDEFQWFCDYNWGKMNSGQQQYALDYLDGAKAKIQGLGKSSGNKIHIIENYAGMSQNQITNIVYKLGVPKNLDVNVYVGNSWYKESFGCWLVSVDVFDISDKHWLAGAECNLYTGEMCSGIWMFDYDHFNN